MSGLTSKLVTALLPIMSILSLVYICFLALTGDGAVKQRITMVIICSVPSVSSDDGSLGCDVMLL